MMQKWMLSQIPHIENKEADTLAKMASTSPMHITCCILVEFLYKPSIGEVKVLPILTNNRASWMNNIQTYLLNGDLSKGKTEACNLRYRVEKYTMIGNQLSKRSYSTPYLYYLDKDKSQYMLQEIHEGIHGNHTIGSSFAHKVIKQGYYQPNHQKDVMEFVKR